MLCALAIGCGKTCPVQRPQRLQVVSSTPCKLPQLPAPIAPNVVGEVDRVSMSVADYQMVLTYLIGLRSWIGTAKDCLVVP